MIPEYANKEEHKLIVDLRHKLYVVFLNLKIKDVELKKKVWISALCSILTSIMSVNKNPDEFLSVIKNVLDIELKQCLETMSEIEKKDKE